VESVGYIPLFLKEKQSQLILLPDLLSTGILNTWDCVV